MTFDPCKQAAADLIDKGRADAIRSLLAAAESEAKIGDGRAKRVLERLIVAAGLGGSDA